MMRILSLASGSKGNAYVVETDGARLLIDDGLPYKTLCARLGATPDFCAVLVTHSHGDHVDGLKTLLRKNPDVPVYANTMTAETVIHDCGIDESAFVCFENGQAFEVGPFTVEPFSIPHDTSDPVGYLVSAKEADGTTVTYFHGTDIGTPLESIGMKFRAADLATLESNHDSVMLRTSGRAETLIRRIAGPRGHLSNDESADLVRKFASPKLKRLALAHLSRDCNSPLCAERCMREALAELKRSDIVLKILSQDEVVEL